jgi:DedD protein
MTPLSDLDEGNDTEITLGMGKMLALFFGLVILCAVFFGMGFSMGKNSVKSAPELPASPTAAAARPSAGAKPGGMPHPASDSKVTQAQPHTSRTDGTPSSPAQSGAAVQQTTTSSGEAGQGYFVQVAAVSKQEDAEALVEALKGRQYSAFIASQPSDKLFHVQVGPFADIKDAEIVRAKLVGDGYNPILKK